LTKETKELEKDSTASSTEIETIESDEQAAGFEEEVEEESVQDEKMPGSKLPWLIHDFEGITENVYEGAMVASTRARQIGRLQKQDIDVWYKSHEPVDGAGEEEETEPGVDHFHHPKPTVKALDELSRKKLTFKYPDKEGK